MAQYGDNLFRDLVSVDTTVFHAEVWGPEDTLYRTTETKDAPPRHAEARRPVALRIGEPDYFFTGSFA